MTAQRPAGERPAGAAPADRPAVSTPTRLHSSEFLRAERQRLARQPGLGLAGLLLVVPVAVLFAFGADGPANSVRLFAPLIIFSLPALAMVAFWWENWPGSRLHSGLSGFLDTALIAAAGIGLAFVGQAVVGRTDPAGVFDPTPGPGHSPLFPASLPLAGGAFVVVLQLTLVWEGWPLRKLPRLTGGIAALVVAWGAAIVLYFVAVDFDAPPGSGLTSQSGPVPAQELGAVLVLIGVWQVWGFVIWRGWPFSEFRLRGVRIVAGNIVVIGGAVLIYALLNGPGGVSPGVLNAAAGNFITAGLIVGMLFEGVFRPYLGRAAERLATLGCTLLLAAAMYAALTAYADSRHLTVPTTQDWVGHAALNALGLSVILHVAIGRRWPFGDNTGAAGDGGGPQRRPRPA